MVFGELQEAAYDYSGSASDPAGKVVRVTPWRFLRGDNVTGSNPINLSALQLLKKPAHNIYGVTIARCCGFAGKYAFAAAELAVLAC